MITHMEPQPIGPLIPFRAGLAILVLVIVVLLLAWFLAPAFPGYHIGHDVCTGHEWLSRVFQGARSWFSMMRGGLIGRGRLEPETGDLRLKRTSDGRVARVLESRLELPDVPAASCALAGEHADRGIGAAAYARPGPRGTDFRPGA